VAAARARPEIVFFDAGGVLVGFPPAQQRVAAALCGLGQERPAAEVARAVALARAARDAERPIDLAWPPAQEDRRVLAAAAVLARELGLDPTRAAYLRDRCYHIHNLTLYPDAVAPLEAAAAAGVRTGLISNAPGSLRGALQRLGILARLRPAVISAEVGCAKPAAGIFAEALRLAGALLVDDLSANVAGARRAGLGALHLHRAGPGGDLRSLAELAARLGWGATAPPRGGRNAPPGAGSVRRRKPVRGEGSRWRGRSASAWWGTNSWARPIATPTTTSRASST